MCHIFSPSLAIQCPYSWFSFLLNTENNSNNQPYENTNKSTQMLDAMVFILFLLSFDSSHIFFFLVCLFYFIRLMIIINRWCFFHSSSLFSYESQSRTAERRNKNWKLCIFERQMERREKKFVIFNEQHVCVALFSVKMEEKKNVRQTEWSAWKSFTFMEPWIMCMCYM